MLSKTGQKRQGVSTPGTALSQWETMTGGGILPLPHPLMGQFLEVPRGTEPQLPMVGLPMYLAWGCLSSFFTPSLCPLGSLVQAWLLGAPKLRHCAILLAPWSLACLSL